MSENAKGMRAVIPGGRDLERVGYLILRAALVVLLCCVLADEWFRAPKASIFLGPLYIYWYLHETKYLAIAGGLWIAMMSAVLKPSILTAVVATYALAFWLLLGLLGWGIGV